MNYSIRRSMSEALRTDKLSEEALSFVAGKAPAPAQVPALTQEVRPAKDLATQGEKTPSLSGDELGASSQRLHSTLLAGTVSMTFRLPTELSARLCSTSTDRKSQRERPFSQQDIVAEALDQWLRRHGGST